MPLYEYECQSCQSKVEVLVRSETDHAAQEGSRCPDCGDGGMHRVFSVTAAPSVKRGASLPVAAENCGAPRCCGGGCQM